ncbi:MAG: bifunctional N-acetylglucosamine-1-phosphate uridyltransferase/glucosamine-1-phosphate acetyltransferase [Planctomycetota bacterium]|nr:MAG: bifunctional N-acetylglucosamine-1-phosphate uridyltransferase/glucosamine-1-phosphate acetyltransferase [Planctomycetota bacterium]
MTRPPLAAIVLAAGRSTRMRSERPKVLHEVLGLPLVLHVVRAARDAGAERVVLVVSPEHREAVAAALAGEEGLDFAVQEEARGTAHAVLAARDALGGFRGTALVLMGDAPCVRPRSLEALLREHRARAARCSLLSGRLDDPRGYGRVVRGPDGDVTAIIEEKDADPATRALREVNTGTFALELPACWELLERVEPSPHTGELYLTDVVQLARASGARVHAEPAADPGDALGVNTRAQLAQVTATLRERINAEHMARGATIVDPRTTFIDARACLEEDVRIEPFTVIEGPCRVARGAVVGPFAHLRGEVEIGPGARVGNFVEVVRSRLGAGSRALHLAYVGDASLGDEVNVGAGTVFANWDGQRHRECEVGRGASLGANTVLVAPARLGAGARTGAGAVVVRTEVPPGDTFVGVPARSRSGAEGSEA